jgi:hypothetical protein
MAVRGKRHTPQVVTHHLSSAAEHQLALGRMSEIRIRRSAQVTDPSSAQVSRPQLGAGDRPLLGAGLPTPARRRSPDLAASSTAGLLPPNNSGFDGKTCDQPTCGVRSRAHSRKLRDQRTAAPERQNPPAERAVSAEVRILAAHGPVQTRPGNPPEPRSRRKKPQSVRE